MWTDVKKNDKTKDVGWRSRFKKYSFPGCHPLGEHSTRVTPSYLEPHISLSELCLEWRMVMGMEDLNCFDKCGQKGGKCEWCKHGGYCCSKHYFVFNKEKNGDCTKEIRQALWRKTFSFAHKCITDDPHAGVMYKGSGTRYASMRRVPMSDDDTGGDIGGSKIKLRFRAEDHMLDFESVLIYYLKSSCCHKIIFF